MNHPLKLLPNVPPWYSEGLRFKCTGCGQCCSGGPGYTWVSDEEIERIANHLNLSIEEFGGRYLRYIDGRYALLEKYQKQSDVYDCIFLKDKKCTIYEVRPTQCKTFPWWQQNLDTLEDWQEAASYCEGISLESPLVSFETIQEQLQENGEHLI